MIRTLIADDHVLIREGFKKLIGKEPGMSVVAECANGSEVLGAVERTGCDVVVLDLNMPGKNGLDVLAELRNVSRSPKVIVLSISPEEQFGVRVMKAGAWGYLTKESAPEELLNAIRKVSSGHKYVSEGLAERMAFDLAGQSDAKLHERLSDREFQVLRLLGAGKTTAEIGEQLSLSINTINTYRKRIQEKTGLRSNGEMVRYAVENGLVD